MGFSGIFGLVFVYIVGYDTFDPVLKNQVPENRFYVMSLLLRILILTISGKR
jgi:hypothetical protein